MSFASMASVISNALTGAANAARTRANKNKTAQENFGSARRLTGSERNLLQFVGTAKPGTGKEARGPHILSGQILSQKGRFADIPSSGGFSRLGVNAFGESVVRSNITGKVGLESGFASIDAKSRALGASQGGRQLSAEDNTRRGPSEKSQRRAGDGGAGVSAEGTKKKNKNLLGTEDILGSQNILG